MSYEGERLSDVLIIIDKQCADHMNDVVARLKGLGAEIDNVDSDNGVIEATVDNYKVPELKEMECVDYVRAIFTYTAGDGHEKPPA